MLVLCLEHNLSYFTIHQSRSILRPLMISHIISMRLWRFDDPNRVFSVATGQVLHAISNLFAPPSDSANSGDDNVTREILRGFSTDQSAARQYQPKAWRNLGGVRARDLCNCPHKAENHGALPAGS
jgi:hypothetical protein